MADLDDFFAKKDKRKAKGKKFTTADEIAKKLEETGKKSKDVKKEKEKPTIPITSTGQETDEPVQQQKPEDDEWKEFEEEKKDYSGLKIQMLQLSDPEDDGDEDEEEEEHENEAGEKVMRKKVQAGPWKMPQADKAEEVAEDNKEVEKDVTDQKGTQPTGPGDTGPSTYRAPHLRNTQQTPLGAIRMRAKSKMAPDINSEEYFPTLSASKSTEPAGAWGKRRGDNERGFEEVRNSKSHSSRGPGSGVSSDMGHGNGSRLTLGNKYGALDQS